MKASIFLLLLASVFVIYCSDSNEPEPELLFSRMEIRYYKTGGWINTSKLYIHKNGTANAYVLSNAKADTLDQGSMILSDEDRYNLAHLFEPFSTFDSYYEPDNPLTDQNYLTTILIYEEIPDTVTVYMLEEANVPYGMRQIIEGLESILNHLVG
jgi:hypothetical protein